MRGAQWDWIPLARVRQREMNHLHFTDADFGELKGLVSAPNVALPNRFFTLAPAVDFFRKSGVESEGVNISGVRPLY